MNEGRRTGEGAGTGADAPAPRLASASPFREEALAEHAGRAARGRALRLAPRWTGWTFAILAVLALALALVLAFGKVHEYAEGPAFVRATDARVVVTPTSGVVADVAVEPGRRVARGDALVRLDDDSERAEYERANREFEGRLVDRLRDPADESVAHALVTLRAERDLARRRLEQRTLRAPVDGVVTDVRARPGQAVSEGTTVAMLTPPVPRYAVYALLPGHHRPHLEKGQRLRLELEGFRWASRWLVVDEVGDQVVGPEEARRFAGPEIGDTLGIDGPVVIVRAAIPDAAFHAGGRENRYFDGMRGTADVPVRRERLAFLIAPWLRPGRGEPVDG